MNIKPLLLTPPAFLVRVLLQNFINLSVLKRNTIMIGILLLHVKIRYMNLAA